MGWCLARGYVSYACGGGSPIIHGSINESSVQRKKSLITHIRDESKLDIITTWLDWRLRAEKPRIG